MIELQNVSFGYKAKKNVLSGIYVTFGEGHIHGLLGCNGVGKTTLLKLIVGLTMPKTGTIAVDGHIPFRRTPSFLSNLVIVPEEFDLPAVTLAEYAKVTSPFYPSFSSELLEHYVGEFNVDAGARMDSVSMGQRKKAYIAFAMACRAKYLIMDEPTNGLDIPSKSTFKSLLASYADTGTTVIISTHQVADIQNLVDNIVIMDNDGVIINETTEHIGRKLKFGLVGDGEDAIWKKETLAGMAGVSENKGGQESTPDLEILFNALVKDREQIIRILNK